MKRIFLFLTILLPTLLSAQTWNGYNNPRATHPANIAVQPVAPVQVKTGLEVARDSGFRMLMGKRIGLITNQTGVDRNLRSTADILALAPGVDVRAFFAPEHGIRGDRTAGAKVATEVDPQTKIKIYSLYGSTVKPTAQMLADIDALVYDIQDNGCRSYTFISTMGRAMEAAAEHGKEFIVFDRPNPLGGNRVEGPMTEEGQISFVSQYPIPYIYGLTAGELARYIKGNGLIRNADKLKLTVVPMTGWSRNMTFDKTGLPWVMTSPNIPTAETCYFYPASGILGELSFLSIGIGYTIPFKTFAAPWIDGLELAYRLNARNIPGIRFRPISYTPVSAKFSGTAVNGVEMFVTDPDAAQLTTVQFYVLEELARLYPQRNAFAVDPKDKGAERRLRMFDQVVGTPQVRKALTNGNFRVESVLPIWNRDIDRFIELSAPYLLY